MQILVHSVYCIEGTNVNCNIDNLLWKNAVYLKENITILIITDIELDEDESEQVDEGVESSEEMEGNIFMVM